MSKYVHKSRVLNKVMVMAALSLCIVTMVFAICYYLQEEKYKKSVGEIGIGDTIVALNEIDNLLTNENGIYNENIELIDEKINTLITGLRNENSARAENDSYSIVVFYIVSIALIFVVYISIYILILRPFDRLEDFAGEIAGGRLDGKLEYKRVNMFGEFTWAFDHMRREIKKSRQCEQEAVENNKTVIATLSHDIKTPIASIRAYAEALEQNMDRTPERRNRYIGVIMKKCDEVTKITDDMFLHSLHDLDKLIIKKEDVRISEVIRETVEAMRGGREDIILAPDICEAVIPEADSGRIAQALENIINNSRKYALGSRIDLHTELCDGSYKIHIRDYGNGIPPEDIPFIFEKFYRGKNSGDMPGAGLGLFIVKYVMEQMNGRVYVNSGEGGTEFVLEFFRP